MEFHSQLKSMRTEHTTLRHAEVEGLDSLLARVVSIVQNVPRKSDLVMRFAHREQMLTITMMEVLENSSLSERTF
eukprot:5638726-Amphidinium_carterae.1